jgi:hypothetical protein
MAEQIKPLQQVQFGGVNTAGHPLQRPDGSSVVCENFRIMPGNWPRLRSGRYARSYQSEGTILQMFDAPPDGGHPFIQHVVSTNVYWKEFEVDSFFFYASPWQQTIATAYDSSHCTTERAAICAVRTDNVFYNGLGVRNATNSRPPFWKGNILTQVRYFGLDAYCPSGNPTVAFAAGAGNNTVLTSVKIWVGLYQSSTEHYSNGVYAGEIETTDATGTITVSALNKLSSAYNSTGERDELKYVFYATVDGGQIPYLILNGDMTGPYTVASTATTASLSIEAGTINGWVLNLDGEMPTQNFPPRPMKQIAWVNGRIYGIPLDGGSGSAVGQQTVGWGTAPDFRYQHPDRYYTGIVYSAAGSDYLEATQLGNPEECWPTSNFSPTTTGEIPKALAPAPDGVRVLVLTGTRAFLVEEIVDRVHEWTQIGQLNGTTVEETLAQTKYGSCWVTQRNEIVLLPPNSLEVVVLSAGYQSLMGVKTPRFGQYIQDPIQELDQYRVYFTDGTSVVHDFATGGGSTSTVQDYTAAGTLTDHYKRPWHFGMKQHIYSTEAQGDSGLVPYADQEFGATSTDITTTAISGTWQGQWDDFGDSNLRKELPFVDLIAGDGTTLEWYADLEAVEAGNTKTAVGTVAPQTKEEQKVWRFGLKNGNAFWHKFVFKLTGSSTQGTFDAPAQQGSLTTNFTGCIMRALAHVSGSGGNRS